MDVEMSFLYSNEAGAVFLVEYEENLKGAPTLAMDWLS